MLMLMLMNIQFSPVQPSQSDSSRLESVYLVLCCVVVFFLVLSCPGSRGDGDVDHNRNLNRGNGNANANANE